MKKVAAVKHNNPGVNMLDIKSELKNMIEQETDEAILKAIKTILEKSHLDPALKEELSQRALAADDDIRNERIFTREQIIDQTDQLLNQ